jgi:hypothetical protein
MIRFVDPGFFSYLQQLRAERERKQHAPRPCPIAKDAVAKQGVGE